MDEDSQVLPLPGDHSSFKPSSLASAVNAKPFVPGGFTAGAARKANGVTSHIDPSSALSKGAIANLVKIEVSQLTTDDSCDGELNFQPSSPHYGPADASVHISTGQGTPRLPKSPSAPQQPSAKAAATAAVRQGLLHVVSDAPSLNEFLPEAFEDNDATATLAPAFSDADQNQEELTAAAEAATAAAAPQGPSLFQTSKRSSDDSSTGNSQPQQAGIRPSSSAALRISIDQANAAKAGSHNASPRASGTSGRTTPTAQPVVDTAAIAAAATLSAIMKVTVNPAAMVNMLGMLGSSPATLTTADIIELAETIQKHPPLMSWLTAPAAAPAAARPASTGPSSGRTTPTGRSTGPPASFSNISTTPESAVMLLSKLGVPVTPETIASAQQLLKQIAAMGTNGGQATGPLPFGLTQQQLTALVDVLSTNNSSSSTSSSSNTAGASSAPSTPVSMMQQQAQLAAMLQFSKSLPSSPSAAAAAAAASAGWAAATASMYPGGMKDPMQAAMAAYFAQQGNAMAAATAMDPYRIAMMSAAMLANPMLANPASWHNPALFMQMAAAATGSKNPMGPSMFPTGFGSFPSSPMAGAAAAAANPFSSAAGFGSADAGSSHAKGNQEAGNSQPPPPPPVRLSSRSPSAAAEQPSPAMGSPRTSHLLPGMDAATLQLLQSLSPKAAEALLHQMMLLQAGNPLALAGMGSPKAGPSRMATYSQDELPSSLASVASAVEQDIQRLQSRSTQEFNIPPPPPPRTSSVSISRATSSANEFGTVRIVPPPPPPPGLPSSVARTSSIAAPPPPPPRKTLSENIDSELLRTATSSGLAAGELAPGSTASKRYSRNFLMTLRSSNTSAPPLDSELFLQLEHRSSSNGGLPVLRSTSSSMSGKLGRWDSQEVSGITRTESGSGASELVRRTTANGSPLGRLSGAGASLARGNSLAAVPPPPPRRTVSVAAEGEFAAGLARGPSNAGAQSDERWDAYKPARTTSTAAIERRASMPAPPPPPPMIRTSTATGEDGLNPLAGYLLPSPPSTIKTHLTAGVLSEFERVGSFSTSVDRFAEGGVSGNLVIITPLSAASSKSSASGTSAYTSTGLSPVPPPPSSPNPRRTTSISAEASALPRMGSGYGSASPPPPPPRRTESINADGSTFASVSRTQSSSNGWGVPPPPSSPPPRRSQSTEGGAQSIQRAPSAIPPPPPRWAESSLADEASSWLVAARKSSTDEPPPPPPPRA